MIKHYFKQALAQLRQHPLISVISITQEQISLAPPRFHSSMPSSLSLIFIALHISKNTTFCIFSTKHYIYAVQNYKFPRKRANFLTYFCTFAHK